MDLAKTTMCNFDELACEGKLHVEQKRPFSLKDFKIHVFSHTIVSVFLPVVQRRTCYTQDKGTKRILFSDGGHLLGLCSLKWKEILGATIIFAFLIHDKPAVLSSI